MSSLSPYPPHAPGYQPGKRLSPATVTGVAAVHVLLGAVLVSMSDVKIDPTIIWLPMPTRTIHPDPATSPPPASKDRKPQEARGVRPVHHDTTALPGRLDTVQPPLTGTGSDDGSVGAIDMGAEPVDPPAAPVLVSARIDSRHAADFQPAYPPALRRAQKEGDVTVRVRIGVDGRVIAVEAIGDADPLFLQATRAQALKAWRFLPATSDGMPVESEKVLTVHFRMID